MSCIYCAAIKRTALFQWILRNVRVLIATAVGIMMGVCIICGIYELVIAGVLPCFNCGNTLPSFETFIWIIIFVGSLSLFVCITITIIGCCYKCVGNYRAALIAERLERMSTA